MGVSRIKTITIAALLLVNAFFAAVIVVDTADDARIGRQAIENACAVLRSGGISIDPDDIVTKSPITTMRTVRVDEAEAMIAQAVLGQTRMTDLGVIYMYENDERGTAEFYSAGDFEIRLNDGAITSESGPPRAAVQGILRDMGLETASLTVALVDGNETVTVVAAYKGANIFNCTTDFIFSDGSLRTIKGRYVTGIEPAEDSAEIMQVGTALLGFLAWVRGGSAECSHIESVEAGYQHSVSGSFGEGAISPAWLITADSGRYIVDDATGEIWPMA